MNLRKLSALIPVVMLPLGLWLGHRALEGRGLAEITDAVLGIPALSLALAFACTAGSYFCLTWFDAIGVRYAGRTLPYPKVALTSFVSLAIGHNVGVAALSSGTMRYRFYSRYGLSGADVAKIVLSCAITVALGLGVLSGIVLIAAPDLGEEVTGLSPLVMRSLGVGALLLAGLYVLACAKVRRRICIRGHSVHLPKAWLALAQVGIGTLNFTFVASALYFLLAGAAPFFKAIAAYVLGNVSALLAHVPGGLGVLEYVIKLVVGNGDVVGALIAFRIVYFLVPLLIGGTLLAIVEFSGWGAKAEPGERNLQAAPSA